MSRDLEVTLIGQVPIQYINMEMALTFSGQNCNLFYFLLSFNLKETQKIPPNVEVCHESLGVM